MKRSSISTNLLTTIAILGLFGFTAPAQASDATKTHAEDEAAIRENVRQMEAGWNAKSGSLFAKPFADDADYVIINGRYIKGRVDIEKAHQQIFDTIFKNTTVRLTLRQIRFLRTDVAVVHITGHRSAAEHEKELGSDAFVTMVMTRDKQGWKIAAFHNTQIRQ